MILKTCSISHLMYTKNIENKWGNDTFENVSNTTAIKKELIVSIAHVLMTKLV